MRSPEFFCPGSIPKRCAVNQGPKGRLCPAIAGLSCVNAQGGKSAGLSGAKNRVGTLVRDRDLAQTLWGWLWGCYGNMH